MRYSCKICSCTDKLELNYQNPTAEQAFCLEKILICKKCGFGEATPSVPVEVLESYYKEKYRSKNGASPLNFNYIDTIKPSAYESRFFAQLSGAKLFLKKHKNINFLDIGAGKGASLSTAETLLNHPKLHVVEPDKNTRLTYQRHFKELKCWSSIYDVNSPMDLILCSHVLEHVPGSDVKSFLSQIEKKLSHNGVLILEVPNNDFRNNDIRKKSVNDAPHLTFFSIESLVPLLNSASLKPLFIETTGALYSNITSNFNPNTSKKTSWIGLKYFLSKLGLLAPLKRLTNVQNNIHTHPNFHYGGDRISIRVYAQKT